jgi:hypothetical protein
MINSKELSANYNSGIYAEYLRVIGEINRVRLSGKATYKETSNDIIYEYKKTKLKIILPRYIRVFTRISELSGEKRGLMTEYIYLRDNILLDINTDAEKYETILNRLKEIDEEIRELLLYYDMINSKNTDINSESRIKIDNNNTTMKKLLEEISGMTDVGMIRQRILEFKRLRDVNEDYSYQISQNMPVDYAIIELPRIIDLNADEKITPEPITIARPIEKIKRIMTANERDILAQKKLKMMIKRKINETPDSVLKSLAKNKPI